MNSSISLSESTHSCTGSLSSSESDETDGAGAAFFGAFFLFRAVEVEGTASSTAFFFFKAGPPNWRRFFGGCSDRSALLSLKVLRYGELVINSLCVPLGPRFDFFVSRTGSGPRSGSKKEGKKKFYFQFLFIPSKLYLFTYQWEKLQ